MEQMKICREDNAQLFVTIKMQENYNAPMNVEISQKIVSEIIEKEGLGGRNYENGKGGRLL